MVPPKMVQSPGPRGSTAERVEGEPQIMRRLGDAFVLVSRSYSVRTPVDAFQREIPAPRSNASVHFLRLVLRGVGGRGYRFRLSGTTLLPEDSANIPSQAFLRDFAALSVEATGRCSRGTFAAVACVATLWVCGANT